ncbi:uncharacterized protein LOC116562396 [Sapajus apella]|uniref:Uncharacterized protein LOC116562396 n=1 Tax=Sapajus apella TaxID=9515 RepID=A0A6J3J7S3_SAPAP|nr:uncharacterized protein LOC116562396 [Sapajus apella]
MEPPGKKVSQLSRRAIRWLGLDCCTFFFVRCIFRNKKKSPTLHTTSSASQDQKLAPWLWEIEPGTPQGVGWDGHLCTSLPTESPIRVGSAPGLYPGVPGKAPPEEGSVSPLTPTPNRDPLSLPALLRTPKTQFCLKFSFKKRNACFAFRGKHELSNWL